MEKNVSRLIVEMSMGRYNGDRPDEVKQIVEDTIVLTEKICQPDWPTVVQAIATTADTTIYRFLHELFMASRAMEPAKDDN